MYRSNLFTIIFFCLGFVMISSNAVCQLWSEDFAGLSDGTTSGPGGGGENWDGEIDGSPSGNFSVQSNVFVGEDIDEVGTEAVWTTEIINLDPTKYYDITMDINWVVNNYSLPFPILTSSDEDYFRLYYVLDGGSEVLIFENISAGLNISGSAAVSQVLKGSTLQIVVRTYTDNVTTWGFEVFEDYYDFDNVTVTEITTIYSLADGNWNSTASWSYDDFSAMSRTSCGCIPSILETTVIGNGNTINLNVNGNTSGLEIQSSSVLRWTADVDLNLYRGGNLTVLDGGFLSQNGRAADIDFEDSDVMYGVEVYDAVNGINVDRFRFLNDDVEININGDGRIRITQVIGYVAGSQNVVLNNNFIGDFTIERINFTDINCSFINSSGSEITLNNLFVASSNDDDNSFTNNGIINIDYIDLNTADFTFDNNGTVNMTGNFFDFGGSESFNNNDGATWNYAGNTTGTGTLEFYLDNGNNTFNYEGTDQEIITPQVNYSNLIIDGGGTKTMIADVDVGGQLTLTDGIIDTDGNTLTFLSNSASVTGGSNSSYVDGLITKLGDGDFTFPTGNGGVWARIGISNLNGTTAATGFTAQYSFSDPGLSGLGSLNNVSVLEGWTLDHTAGSIIDADVTLYFEDANRSEIDDLGDLVIARHNGANWEDEGGTAGGNFITTNISSFSPFTFGSNDPVANPLPVNLISFDILALGNDAIITWETASEQNNDFFTIERSLDGINYEIVGTVDGNGTTNQKSSYSYTDQNLSSGLYYYRLKQTDFDGAFEYFRPDFIEIEGESSPSSIVLYPNPVINNQLNISLGNLLIDSNSKLEIMDVNGRLVDSFAMNNVTIHPNHEIEISLHSGFQSGFYLLKLSIPDKGVITKSFLIK